MDGPPECDPPTAHRWKNAPSTDPRRASHSPAQRNQPDVERSRCDIAILNLCAQTRSKATFDAGAARCPTRLLVPSQVRRPGVPSIMLIVTQGLRPNIPFRSVLAPSDAKP